MSPTLLEGAIALLLIVVAWQIGVTLAPMIRRGLRTLRDDLDDAGDEATLHERDKHQ